MLAHLSLLDCTSAACSCSMAGSQRAQASPKGASTGPTGIAFCSQRGEDRQRYTAEGAEARTVFSLERPPPSVELLLKERE